MTAQTIIICASLQAEIDNADERTRKLFSKQKSFMSEMSDYPSLARKKLRNITDKYGNPVWEIRLDIHRRIAFVVKDGLVIWLKIMRHDEVARHRVIQVEGY